MVFCNILECHFNRCQTNYKTMERNERLTTLRILNGLTQDLLSTRSGLPRGSISIWEKGNNAPSHDAVPKLSAALNVPAGYLMYGSPPLDAAVWQPMVPAPRHLPALTKELANNMAGFCVENLITRYACYQGDDGRVIFLGKADRPFSFLLLQKPELDECISKALETLEEHAIEGPDLMAPLQIGFLEKMDVEHLLRFVRLAQNINLEVDDNSITTEFLKIKQNLGFLSGNPKNDFTAMVADCLRVASQADLPTADRLKMERAFATIREIAAKNNIKVNLPVQGKP